MIRMGRYDAFDKWSIVCRAWAGEAIDVGVDRHGRPALAEWKAEAFAGGCKYCLGFLSLKHDALDAGEIAEESVNAELVQLVQQIGFGEFRERALRCIDDIRESGFDAPACALPPRIAGQLKKAFEFGALMALRWTEDVGEIPDTDVLHAKRWSFPRHATHGRHNVLSMFCARQYGVLDVIHVHDACPDAVTLVDMDPVCLDVMKRIYPPEWTYVCADYKEFLRDAEAQGLVYDLVTADPWEAMCVEVGFDMFQVIAARGSDMLVFHYLQRMFDELGAGPGDFASLSRAIRQRTGVDVVVVDWVERSWDNGWLVMRKRPGASA